MSIGGGAIAALHFGSLTGLFVTLALALFVSGTIPLLALRKQDWQ